MVSGNFKEELSDRFLHLLAERGRASELARIVGRAPSFVNGVKQGNPVNALHLKAVGELLGSDAVLNLLDLKPESSLKVVSKTTPPSSRVADLLSLLSELEKEHPDVFARIEAYIQGAADAVKCSKK